MLEYPDIMPIKTGMDNSSAEHARILEHARKWRGEPMAIATVVKTWRSAPCPVGTHMLIHGDGRFTGSVSGGCVEADILQTAADVISGAPAILREYGVADADAWDAGLPCGGDIAVLVQPVSPQGFDPEIFGAIDTAIGEGRSLRLATGLKTGRSRIINDKMAVSDGEFTNLYLPPRRLLIIGAVEIAVTLSAIASAMGVDVTVIDPRGHFLTEDRFPGRKLDDRWPDEAIADLRPDIRTAIVTLSHDPKIDDPALVTALNSQAKYIAALGSRRSHANRRLRLADAGIATDRLDRIEGPAGVAINAISAGEIALSIAAGMIRAFNDGLR